MYGVPYGVWGGLIGLWTHRPNPPPIFWDPLWGRAHLWPYNSRGAGGARLALETL